MNKKKSIILLVVVIIILAVVALKKPATKTAAPTLINTVTYMCDSQKQLTAAYYDGASTASTSANTPPVPGGSVIVTLPDGTTQNLKQTISADGGRYANADESFVFWNKGNGVMVLQNNEQKDYTGCIAVAPNPTGMNLSQIYASATNGFSIRTPDGYTPTDPYLYQLTPDKTIPGAKFTIPEAKSTGTNLGGDTYISVEHIAGAQTCTADMFMSMPNIKPTTITENGTDYSLATSTDAGAGNRYQEAVYAIPGSSPCTAVRYFIHYSVFENYPKGSITEFDEGALVNEFDAIRHTLTLNPTM